MKKLKELLKESYVWERKFGEKLPTLADVQKAKKLNEVGASAEYRKHMKRLDKTYDAYWKAVQDFGKVLEKKGLKKQSLLMHKKYYKGVLGFKAWFKGWVDRLL